MRLHILQHLTYEGPGVIADYAQNRDYELLIVHVYAQEPLPPIWEVDLAVVLGGTMSVNDDLPWLAAERRWLEDLILAGRPVVGICLGAQQLAKVLGQEVFVLPQREVGWWPLSVQLVADLPPLPTQVLHWHGEGFDLPADAHLLASTPVTACQGFAFAKTAVPNATRSVTQQKSAFAKTSLHNATRSDTQQESAFAKTALYNATRSNTQQESTSTSSTLRFAKTDAAGFAETHNLQTTAFAKTALHDATRSDTQRESDSAKTPDLNAANPRPTTPRPHVIAWQFHPEADRAWIGDLSAEDAEYLAVDTPYVAKAADIVAVSDEVLAKAHAYVFAQFDYLLAAPRHDYSRIACDLYDDVERLILAAKPQHLRIEGLQQPRHLSAARLLDTRTHRGEEYVHVEDEGWIRLDRLSIL